MLNSKRIKKHQINLKKCVKMLARPNFDEIDLGEFKVTIRDLEDLRLLGTFYCSTCGVQSPNDIFSPFRTMKCNKCKKEIINKEGVEKLLELILNKKLFIDILVGRKIAITLTMGEGELKSIPLEKVDLLRNRPIQMIAGHVIPKDANVRVFTQFDRENIQVTIVQNVKDDDKILESIKTRLIVFFRDTSYSSHIPAWESTFLHAINLVRRSEFGLALVLLHTSLELFLSKLSELVLKSQKCVREKMLDSLMKRPSIKKFQKGILWQVCGSSYNSGNSIWSEFNENVTKKRKDIVHRDTLDTDIETLKKGVSTTYRLMVYILEQLEPEHRKIVLRKWNRDYKYDENWNV